MEIRYWTSTDTTPIDWASRKDELRPATLTNEVWTPIYNNLTGSLGTTGAYIQMLSDNAQYLGRLGEKVTNIDDLWNFEIQQAFGYTAVPYVASAVDASMPSVGPTLILLGVLALRSAPRYGQGPFGRGWYTPWQTTLTVESGGDLVSVSGEYGSRRTSSAIPATALLLRQRRFIHAHARFRRASINSRFQRHRYAFPRRRKDRLRRRP